MQLRLLVLMAGFVLAGVGFAGAQDIPQQPVGFDPPGSYVRMGGTLTGSQMQEFVVTAEAGQTLSVDILTQDPPVYFNLLPPGGDVALFVGSTSGAVADVPLAENGAYRLRLYLMRSAARRDEVGRYDIGLALTPPDFADGLRGGPDFWAVSGLQTGSTLNLRAGPDTRYAVRGVLRQGDILQNQGCRLTGDLRWCQVRAQGTGLTGWVAGSFLSEATAPTQPTARPGGPKGNGTPFDATGQLPCTLAGQVPGACSFGVIRDGPGNAGVWIATGGGAERHILFERGAPVAVSPASGFTHTQNGDTFVILIAGTRFDIPQAVIDGG